jgi:hypothetical protein
MLYAVTLLKRLRMNVANRTKDIVSGTEDLEFVFQLKNFPVFQGCTDKRAEHDVVHDLSFYIGRTTGMVQSQELLPLDIVYQDAHTPGAVGQIWTDHHKAFAEFIYRARPVSVLEIGGSHGILSQCYDELALIDWTIIEPAPVPNPNLRARLVKGFFDADTNIEADMVVHSHVLEHIYDPANFFAALSRRPQGSKMCFSIPALEQHIAQMYTNALSFEHTYFCTEDFVEYWLAQSGYAIVDKQHFRGHSIFYSTVRSDVEAVPMPDVYAVNKRLFDQFVAHHQHNVDTLNAAVKASTVPVYLFGAHVFSQFLLSMGLDESKIVAVLDNSQAKQGRRLYGSKLLCYSPEALAHVKDAIVILQAGQYTEEIRNQILEINPGIKFI